MTVIGFISAKHSPGVTTAMLAIGIASAQAQSTIAIEADPAGGDLAAMCNLTLERGLLSATAASRGAQASDLARHIQNHGGLGIIVAPTAPSQMANALQATGLATLQAAKAASEVALVDFGRMDTAAGLTIPTMLDACDQLVVVTRPTLASAEHLRSRLPLITQHPRVSLLVVGSQPYRPHEVAEAIGLKLVGRLPFTERDVELITQKPAAKATLRCALMQAATTVAGRILKNASVARSEARNQNLVAS